MNDLGKNEWTSGANLSYWVGFKTKQAYDEVEDNYYPSELPILYSYASPIVSRLSAISFVTFTPAVSTSVGKLKLCVYLRDNLSYKDYLIYNGADQPNNHLENLETELLLYVQYGYSYFGWDLITDQYGNSYKVMNMDDWLG